MTTNTEQHRTIRELRQMSIEDQRAQVKKLNKEPRGDLIILLLGLVNEVDEEIHKHPYLQAAHKRAKRAEERRRNNPDQVFLARRAEKDACRRMNNALRFLEKQAEYVRDLQQQLADAHEREEILQANIDSLEKCESELIDETKRLARGFNTLAELRFAEKSAHHAELMLVQLDLVTVDTNSEDED